MCIGGGRHRKWSCVAAMGLSPIRQNPTKRACQMRASAMSGAYRWEIVDSIHHISQKGPSLQDINISCLPQGQRRAVVGLLGGDEARTYWQAAALAGIGVGTLYCHLRRIRRRHPELYAVIREVRRAQLATRHEAALRRAERHSRDFHRRSGAYRYYERFGHWPWQR